VDVVLASARSDLILALEVFLREQPGMIVVGTATGARGLLALVETISPDLLVLDWALPGLPPAEVLAAARAVEPPPTILVLGRGEGEREASLAAGADAYVQRGDSPDTLISALQRICPRQAALDEPTPSQEKGAQEWRQM
jgi:DNA-binding NarL/FixJ family response regulator